MPDAYCRGCDAAFPRPLPAPYGAICPNCLARGDIVTLTDLPRSRLTGRDRPRGDAGQEPGRTRFSQRPARPLR